MYKIFYDGGRRTRGSTHLDPWSRVDKVIVNLDSGNERGVVIEGVGSRTRWGNWSMLIQHFHVRLFFPLIHERYLCRQISNSQESPSRQAGYGRLRNIQLSSFSRVLTSFLNTFWSCSTRAIGRFWAAMRAVEGLWLYGFRLFFWWKGCVGNSVKGRRWTTMTLSSSHWPETEES